MQSVLCNALGTSKELFWPIFEVLVLLIGPNEFPEAGWKLWHRPGTVPVCVSVCLCVGVPVYTGRQADRQTHKHQSSVQEADLDG